MGLKQLVSGIPSSPPNGTSTGSAPLPSGSAADLPFSVNFNGSSKKDEMTLRIIITIAISFILLLLGMVGGAFYIIFKWRKVGRPSSAAGLPFTSSLINRSGTVSNFMCVCFVKYFSDVYIEVLRFFRSTLRYYFLG